ncbi:uncharacterized protein KD926_003165 [Aspergillus affinis]|uniref:uncharacterized protein n=1 Tax=Aspergillus affinis TaxID=1070780 RepID=UPI0022FE200C|nr:uncharacterized protein KD926_003165 [Aspergillus affinis]KAI9035654.1 hypothetical protein KD926_003165 [Aspergillus affinis]
MGKSLCITSHIAPAPTPTPLATNYCHNGPTGREERGRLTPLERCLRNPPLPGDTGSQSTTLKILAPLEVGDYHNAQVFVAERQDADAANNQKKKVVAKVYNPLYFDDLGGYLNPFRCVDKHYTHEVHTYALLAHLQGTLIPTFYGSFSLEIPVPGPATRVVRLILIEYIPGICMLQAHPEEYPLHSRQEIIKWIIDFESRVFQLDIVLTDLCPRNLMLLDPSDHPQRMIVFLDFGGAV